MKSDEPYNRNKSATQRRAAIFKTLCRSLPLIVLGFISSIERSRAAGVCSAVVSNALGSETGEPASLTATQLPPNIISQPVSQPFHLGENVILQVLADGPGPVNYQWCFDGVAIPGATNASLVISNASYGSRGVYTVVVRNPHSPMVTSNPALLFLPFELEFSTPEGPLIWDFSGTYPPPLSMTLYQDAEGSLVNNFGARGRVADSPSFMGLSFSLISRLDDWRRVDSYTMEYVFQSSCATSLILDQASRLLTGETRCTILSQRYAFFLFDWVPYRDLTTNYTTESVAVPLPAGTDGCWRLALDVVPNGNQSAGQAFITLSSGNAIQLEVTGTNATVTKSMLVLQSSPNFLKIVTLGPEMSLQSIHGNVAGQSVDYDAPARTNLLSLNINGSGSVTPLKNGQALVIGKDYTLKAAPRPGNLFSNWIVAGIPVTSPALRFTVCSNLVITANFVTNPFIPANGVYNGLFSEPGGVRQQSAGFFTLTLSTSSAFSGSISLNGGTHSFSGRFDISGKTQILVRRGSKSPLTGWLEMNFEDQQIHGTLTDENWTAVLFADRACPKPATNYEGVSTLVIPGNDSAADLLGDGYVTLWIDYYGMIHASGKLADGTAISRSVKISQSGLWPLYVPLYGNKGSIMSWICFSNQPASSLGGDLIWFKPAKSSGKFYPAGFTNQTAASGSSFWGPGPSNGRLQSKFTNGLLILAGGNLPLALTNTFHVNGAATGTNRINLRWNVISGAVSGSFIHPATGRSTALQGVLLQNQNVARGFFLGTNQSGSFFLQQ